MVCTLIHPLEHTIGPSLANLMLRRCLPKALGLGFVQMPCSLSFLVEANTCWSVRYPISGMRSLSISFTDQSGDVGLRITKVSIVTRACRAAQNTGRDAVFFIQVFIVDAINTQSAFLHNAFEDVIFPRAIGASPGTEFASNTFVFIHQNDAVGCAFVGRASRANGDAGGILAVEARAREVEAPAAAFGRGHFVAVHPVEPNAVGFCAVGVGVGEGRHVGRQCSIPCSW